MTTVAPVSPSPRRRVVHVACGGGQQGCTGAVTLSGELYTFGDVTSYAWGHGEAEKMLRKSWENAGKMGIMFGFRWGLCLDFGGIVNASFL